MQYFASSGKVVRRWLLTLAATVLAFGPLLAQAGVVNYRFVLTVDSIDACDRSSPVPLLSPDFGCGIAIGDAFTGRFQIEQDLAGSPDGLYDVPFKSMFLRTGDVEWDHSKLPGTCSIADPNCLEIYRNIAGPDYFTNTGTGFFVRDGEIAGFAGGFVGPGDGWFIDFDYLFGLGAGRFAALAQGPSPQYMTGTYSIHRVSLPSPLALLAMGMLFLVVSRMAPRISSASSDHRCDQISTP